MTDLLMSSPLLTVFLVVALGAILGVVPFGPLRLGAAGALFVGLIVGNAVPELGQQLAVVQTLGLALFVYTVGLSAGQTFFHDLKRQSNIMLAAVGALLLGAGGAVLGGRMLGLDVELAVGVYAGSMTATPALAAATSATGNDIPAVGYSLGYPMGVIVGIIAVAMVVSRKWPEKNETPSLAGQSLFATTVVVQKSMAVREVPGWQDQVIRMSYLRRGDKTRIISPGEELLPDDRVVFVGRESDVRRAIAAVGQEETEHLADDRSAVEFSQFTVSNKELSGQSIAELSLNARFGGVVTRILRGDLELLARENAVLEIGDRVMVAYPRSEADHIRRFFGDSERRISQIDAIPLGLGLVLGLLLGMVEIGMPGGGTFSLGSAAGPLVVGMILGYLQRTGPLIWQLPQATNQTIRQLGLLLFLAAVGIASGPAFMETAFTASGAQGLLLGVGIALIVLALTGIAGRVIGLSAQRTAGAMSGVLGQPALLAYAMSKENDERIESGYAAIFALGIIAKIVFVSLILAF